MGNYKISTDISELKTILNLEALEVHSTTFRIEILGLKSNFGPSDHKVTGVIRTAKPFFVDGSNNLKLKVKIPIKALEGVINEADLHNEEIISGTWYPKIVLDGQFLGKMPYRVKYVYGINDSLLFFIATSF